ncbi:hypothetical protein G9A89_002464 [Geosiphon pyriformis]|nr:hypothetical protein G9A89_002464 [Geosiphon pyriformis]
MAICEKILINNDVRKPSSHSDQEIVVKKILVDFLKLAVESVFSKFGKVVSIKMQLIGLWQKALVKYKLSEIADLVTVRWSVLIEKNSVHITKTVDDKQLWIFRDLHQALLYTLSVSTTAYDFSDLLELYDGKTCFIGRNLSLYMHDRCVIVCFVDKVSKLAAIGSTPVFKSVNLCWAGFSLAHCAHCKQFGHISTVCLLSRNSGAHVVADPVVDLSLSSSKVLTNKVSELEFKMVALKVSVGSVLKRLNHLCSGFMTLYENLQHVMFAVSTSLPNRKTLSTKLRSSNRPWIRDKFGSVRVFSSGLDKRFLGTEVTIIIKTSLACHVYKISEVSDWFLLIKLLFKNKLFMLILGLYAGAFLACASFKKCLDFGLVNSLGGSFYVKTSTWANSQGVAKTINFLFVFSNLVNAVVDQKVSNVGEFFNTDHQAVFVSVGLGELLDAWLNFLCKQGATSANAAMFSNKFATSVRFSNLDAMWGTICKIMVFLANEVFKKKWFKDFNDVFTKKSSRFYKLELLVSKIVRALHKKNIDVVNSGASSNHICSALFGAKKSYCTAKLTESLKAKKANIRSAIDRRIESFEINKGYIIRSVLECFFRKVALDHLIVDNKLILKSDLVKSKYVFNEAFSGVMCLIEFNKLIDVVSNLLNGKAAGLLVVIPINSRASNPYLSISGSPISIAKKRESHWYLGIFLSIEGLLKPSLTKTNSDIHFFTNLVLRKAVSDKQLLYLVLVVLYPIVSYKMQFSFIPVGVCNKWNALVHKDLKLKSGLPLDFPNNTIHYPSFYGLKSFLQVQSESKVAFLVNFANSDGYSVAFVNQFWNSYGAVFDWCTFRWWKRLDSHGLVLKWFKISVVFLNGLTPFSAYSLGSNGVGYLSILEFDDFASICDCFS